jgi:hypothetical protein
VTDDVERGRQMSDQARHARVTVATVTALLCTLAVAACGGGSKSPATSASASSSAPGSTTATGATGTTPSSHEIAAGEAVLAEYRACLAKYGVKLPASKIGEPIRSPTGATPAQYASARQKCRKVIAGPSPVPSGTGSAKGGGGTPAQTGKVNIPKGTPKVAPTNPKGSVVVPNGIGGSGKAHGKRLSTHVSARTLAHLQGFAACMRENGVNVPAPTKSSPFFVPKGVDVKGPQFQAAEAKCLPRLSAR